MNIGGNGQVNSKNGGRLTLRFAFMLRLFSCLPVVVWLLCFVYLFFTVCLDCIAFGLGCSIYFLLCYWVIWFGLVVFVLVVLFGGLGGLIVVLRLFKGVLGVW